MTTLDLYQGRRPLKPRFWLTLAYETLGRRRVRALVAARMATERLARADGLDHVPMSGAFILAVNHFSGRAAFDTAAAVLAAIGRVRPDALDAMTIVVGQRRATPKWRHQRVVVGWLRRIVDVIFARWQAHVVRIPLRNVAPDASGLRDWRSRQQPVFVFPEGRAKVAFGGIRRGAGRWLATLDMPVVPVGVWWTRDSGWHVCFGAPLVWTHRDDLRDVQLGLAMAALLPDALALDWQADLARWRAAHETP